MALVWADCFDIYGTAGGSNSFMLNAGYNAVNASGWVAGRTGANAINLFNSKIQRPLDTSVTTLGQGAAINVQSIGSVNVNAPGIGFESAGGTMECRVVVQPDLSFAVYDRTSVLKGSTAPNSIVLGSFYWLEVKAIGNAGGVANTGIVEVRINGVTKVTINGINLPNAFAFHSLGGSTGGQAYWDDYIVWDTTGPNAWTADFMGDRRLVACFPNANGTLQDFTANPAPAWDCLNNDPPADGTSYIEGTAAGNVSEFGKTAIGINSNDIAAMFIVGRLFKSDAGTATGRIGVNSNGNVLNSPAESPGTTGALFHMSVETDPNTNLAWTRTAYDAANLRVTRDS